MRKIRELFLNFWSVFAFADKVALVAAAVGVITFASTLAFTAIAYRADKESYLYELQRLRAQSVAAQIQVSLETSKKFAKILAPASSLLDAENLGLARLPENDETFITQTKILLKAFPSVNNEWKKQAATAIFRSPNGDLLGAPISSPNLLPEDGTIFVVSNEGVLLGAAGPSAPNAENVDSRASVKMALQSGITESTTTLENRGAKQVVAHLEIPNTNLLVFAEVTLERLMNPFYKALRVLSAFGLFVIFLGAVLSFFATKAVAKPAQLATEFLLKIAQGDYSARPHYASKDEFATIFAGIDYLANKIVSREERLRLFGAGLQAILARTGTWKESLTPEELCSECAFILGILFKNYRATAFVVRCGEIHRVFNATSLELEDDNSTQHNVDPSADLKTESALEIPILSRTKKKLMLFSVVGVRPTTVWPETMHTVAQFGEAIAAYFDRRVAAQEHARKMRQDSEIALAAAIQKSLVAFPENVPNIEIARHYIPAEQMGGDWTAAFYDEEIRTLRFFMGDATGHGVAPSIVTAVVAGATRIFQNASKAEMSSVSWPQKETAVLQKLATELNSIVLDVGNNKIGMTMIMGSLHCDTGEISLLSLGHPSPIWIDNTESPLKKIGILPINAYLGDSNFVAPKCAEFCISSNQGVLVFTDGLLENYSGKITRRWLKECANSTSSADNIIAHVVGEYGALTQKHGLPADDVALLAIRWLGPVSPSIFAQESDYGGFVRHRRS